MILLHYLHIQSHPTHLSVRDQETGSTSPHSIPHYAQVSSVKSKYCLRIQSRTTLLWVLVHDTVPISPHLIPSITPICQKAGYCFDISTFNYPTHLYVRSPWYCFNISTFNPILHTYLSETRILFQYLHIQSHPTHLSVRDQDTVSISPHSIPSYTHICQKPWNCFNISTFKPSITPICQRPGYCFIISTCNPILHTFLSETMIPFQYLGIQSNPTHLTVRDQDTDSISPHSIHPTHLSARDQNTVSISPQSIPSFTPICQRTWYCFNISTFNPILHTYLSKTSILLQCLHFNPILLAYLSETIILLQYLHIQSHPTHLSVRDQDTASIHLHIQSHLTLLSVRDHDTASFFPNSITSYRPISQRPGYCFNISTFNPILHTYLSETMTLFQYLHIQSHPTQLSVRDHDTASISQHSIPSFTPVCQRPGYCCDISTFNPILHTYLSDTMILFQYLHIQSHPTQQSVRDHDTASISPHSIPSDTPICQRPWYCFNISTYNPILHTYLSETMMLFQYLHIQPHPSHLAVRDHDTVSISPHSIPSYTPICQRPGPVFYLLT